MVQARRAPRKTAAPKPPVSAEAVAEGSVSAMLVNEAISSIALDGETHVVSDSTPVVSDAPKPPHGVTEAKYVACRTLTVKGRTIRAGEPVPEAEGWPRVETWVNHGYIKAIVPRGI